MKRWQKVFLVTTLIFAFLTVDVWRARGTAPRAAERAGSLNQSSLPRRRFYYSRSLNCCLEVRAFLGCSAAYLEPCREFTGDCADLQAQFTGVPDSGIPDDYECAAFPDEKSIRDKVIVGLICFAVGLPFAVLIEELFAMRRARASDTLPSSASRAHI